MIRLHVGGVPEHFNHPWHEALAGGAFAAAGLDVRFTEYPSGTGAMCRDLRAGTLDVAVVLTEGIVADIARHGGSRIIAGYVDTPLTWGVHVAAQSAHERVAQLEGQPLAISRFGSGSHLMSALLAREQGWEVDALRFEAVDGGLPELCAALDEGRAAAFLWERFTTKPLVDGGALRRVGVYPTPWPCFVIAAGEGVCVAHAGGLRALLGVIQARCAAVAADRAGSVQAIAARYGLAPDDVADWIQGVRWSRDGAVSRDALRAAARALASVGRAPADVDVDAMLAPL